MAFPDNFLWGDSTSAFQIEGIAGRGLATTDRMKAGIASSRTACDHYHHWIEDIDLMHEMGLKAYRMGFSWRRIMPDRDMHISAEGMAFYDQIIDRLLGYGIEPVVTLYHFECPRRW